MTPLKPQFYSLVIQSQVQRLNHISIPGGLLEMQNLEPLLQQN